MAFNLKSGNTTPFKLMGSSTKKDKRSRGRRWWDKATQIGMGLRKVLLSDRESVGGSDRWPTPRKTFIEAYKKEKAHDEAAGKGTLPKTVYPKGHKKYKG